MRRASIAAVACLSQVNLARRNRACTALPGSSAAKTAQPRAASPSHIASDPASTAESCPKRPRLTKPERTAPISASTAHSRSCRHQNLSYLDPPQLPHHVATHVPCASGTPPTLPSRNCPTKCAPCRVSPDRSKPDPTMLTIPKLPHPTQREETVTCLTKITMTALCCRSQLKRAMLTMPRGARSSRAQPAASFRSRSNAAHRCVAATAKTHVAQPNQTATTITAVASVHASPFDANPEPSTTAHNCRARRTLSRASHPVPAQPGLDVTAIPNPI